MRTIQRKIVAALIFSKDKKIFQGMRDPKSGGVYIDCWHIPGGGVEENETEQQALIREIQEETGIDISIYPIELVDDKGTGQSEKTLDTGEKVLCEMTFSVYKINITDKNADEIIVSLNDDLASYQWINISELKDVKITPPSKELFTRLGYI